jgi:hypothetical protein
MKKLSVVVIAMLGMLLTKQATAQIDFNNLNVNDILGRVIKVDKGFSPKFYVGNLKIPKVDKLGEILGMKKNQEINKLFKTFKTGRTVYKVATYAGSAIALYGAIKSLDKSAAKSEYQAAFASSLGTIASGVIVKLLTKNASYKAVDIFNNTARKAIKDIFKIGASSHNMGVGVYVTL